MEPFLKWAGGKRQILSSLDQFIKKEDLVGHRFYEPFVGGGSVFLHIEHCDVVINDSNKELMNSYKQLKLHPNELIKLLESYAAKHNKEFYYEVRNLDRSDAYNKLSSIERAARFIYLNRTCFNGLYRVNRQGFFNVPIGNYAHPQIVRDEQILRVSKYLNEKNIDIRCGDFELTVKDCRPGDIIYCDPPYDYGDSKSGFNKYTANSFFEPDLKRLGAMCDDLISKGCTVIISNNDTLSVREIFSNKKYIYKEILSRRIINNSSDKRKGVKEVIIVGK